MNWISIKDKMPEEHQRVLVVDIDNDIDFGTYWQDMDGEIFWNVSYGRNETITHWMPLPHGPNPEKESKRNIEKITKKEVAEIKKELEKLDELFNKLNVEVENFSKKLECEQVILDNLKIQSLKDIPADRYNIILIRVQDILIHSKQRIREILDADSVK